MANTIPNPSSVLPFSLDDYFQTLPIGSLNRAILNNAYGINHRQVPGMVSSNWDLYGLTFFTRPQLNLQSDNIRNIRQFYPLLTDNDQSMQRFVRTTLDPRLMAGYKLIVRGKVQYSVPPIGCSIVDNDMAFIPILTNNISSISGWPDLEAPTFTSKAGLYNQSYSHVDGSVKRYETFDIDATFRNVRGDPILFMYYIWLWYQASVFEGYLVPYTDFITENEVDYNTRIYRLVLDQTRTYVKKIAATGAAFPINVPMGSFFDYTTDKPYNDQNKDFTIRFRCNGVNYMDDILIYEFNQTVVIFNPSMSDTNRPTSMVKINKSLLVYFNNRGYPRIDNATYELEWWIPIALYQNRLGAFIGTNLVSPTIQNTETVPSQPIF